ncbi:MAG: filamentous hemagglutinin N-terminal domain-containing protein [Nitrospinaceae bacterium]|nr:filamentous hemagglutinin N-terminal domain-containing protein [Nitrospinaceae bacterium]NIR57118.1 filamentous hemagglutinin N-terminal domain-containing protein [Nitrospinaceae bacterium]NIS87559.1 filamentous hemagglutinin N-terminal domain-containing protein [Nitrospinaceae bacterium]NIT84429.1 filamentous hemagglutinin N-terminal domain-containing protein [Nitrospinaceae bacterium]NIU46616.1 filamentous hemagglutinin N-terminal domain-containing protein [Nitrospinaceae bacterium]
MVLWLIHPAGLFALPSEGEIVSGSGAIQQTSSQDLVIQQNSSSLIANWESFSIQSTESVTFNQPGTHAVALNRVVGTDPSLILGKLSGNGQVFLINPSGVVFGQGAVVDVHGFLASTLNISNEDFLNRQYDFNQDSDQALAAIINRGTIRARNYASLMAPAVVNEGSIVVADLGSVALGSGTAVTVDFNGDVLISFAVTEEVSGMVTDTNGQILQDRIDNSGLIQANGGRVFLTAMNAGDIIGNVVNHSGVIQAQTVQKEGGKIILSGGDQGIVRVSGTLDGSGQNSGDSGGTVQILGQSIGLFESAVVDVSGRAGGGTVLIGGDHQGRGEVPTAQASYIGQDTVILADATESGDGGTVVIWSEEATQVHGRISARGGPEGGDGGWVETSGRLGLVITQNPDVSAPEGQGGVWLIDPGNIEVVEGSGNTGINDSDPFEPLEADSQLGVDLILAALKADSEVRITTGDPAIKVAPSTGNIVWNADLDYNGTGNSTLFLSAHNDIIFNNSIFTSDPGGGDRLNLNLRADSDQNGAGSLIVGAGATLFTNNGFIDILGHDLTLDGTLNSGSSDVLFVLSDGGTLNLDSGDPSGSNIGGSELSNIFAQNLLLSTDGNINVKGLEAADTVNIQDSLILASGKDINLEGTASTFGSLQLFAFNDINVNADVSTLEGDFIARADSDNNGVGDFNVADGSVISSARDIDISANSINATTDSFQETDRLILNGNIAGSQEPVPDHRDAIQQGSLGTFLTDFLQNGGPDC